MRLILFIAFVCELGGPMSAAWHKATTGSKSLEKLGPSLKPCGRCHDQKLV